MKLEKEEREEMDGAGNEKERRVRERKSEVESSATTSRLTSHQIWEEQEGDKQYHNAQKGGKGG